LQIAKHTDERRPQMMWLGLAIMLVSTVYGGLIVFDMLSAESPLLALNPAWVLIIGLAIGFLSVVVGVLRYDPRQ
jgi:uncharacterized membrane protein YeiH